MIGHGWGRLALVTALAATLPGCASVVDSSMPASGSSPAATVTTSTRTITSVLVVQGTVTISPQFAVVAPDAGVLDVVEKSAAAPALDAGARLATISGSPIDAPAAGRVTGAGYPDGAVVAKGAPVLTMAYRGFGIPVDVPADALYRVYSTPTQGTVSVTSGPAGITCDLQPAPPGAVGTDDATPLVVCLLPLDTDVVAGLPAKVGIQTARHESVLALPVSAVLGSADSGRVTLIRNGNPVDVDVSLGISDGSYIEITAGLAEGDVVMAYAPGLE